MVDQSDLAPLRLRQRSASSDRPEEDYLRLTLRDLKSGEQPGYTCAMTETLRQVTEDLDLLTYFAANLPGK
jgi:hypothetical protein